MLDTPWLVPVAVAIIIMGFGYLTLTKRPSIQEVDNIEEAGNERQWHVQCPNCSRWKTMAPDGGNYDTDQLNNPQPSTLIGNHNRYVNEFKCHFCGHQWLEQYIE